MPINMKSYRTPIMIIAVCAIALGPLFSGFFGPDGRARWLLAWAANAYQNGDPDNAERTLERASELSSAIATDEEFWNLKFDLVFNKEKRSQEDIAKLFKESMALILKVPKPRQAKTATDVAQRFHLKKLNDQAVELMETFYAPLAERKAGENNDLAYFRSLAKKKLDTALKEIDAALIADGTSRKEFLDTKAWVLHGLKRDEEALRFADEAIVKLAAEFKKILPASDQKTFLAMFFPEFEKKTDEVKNAKPDIANPDTASYESGVLKKEFDSVAAAKTDELLRGTNRLEVLKDLCPHINPIAIDALARQVASLRYHRACILDELGRSVESDLDYAWLDQFGYANTAEIF